MNSTDASGPTVVVVGSGHGIRVHLPALRRNGFDVVALVGNDPERTRRRAERNAIPDAFTDLDEALAATGADAVTVASPSPTHRDMVMTALSKGCHVMCEKPFASNTRQAKEMLEAAERAGVVHMLGNQMRSLPNRIVAGRAIADGAIGEPRYLTFVQHIGLLADTEQQWPDWWFSKESGGGWLGASGSHMIDHVRSWLGDFASLSAALPVVADRDRNVAEDTYNIRFRMACGVEGTITQSAAAWGPQVHMNRVVGSHGTLWLENERAWIADRNGTRELPVPAELELAKMEPSDDPRKQYLHVELPPSLKLFETFRSAIEGGTGTEPFADFRDGHAAMQVIDAARASAAGGGSLTPVGEGTRISGKIQYGMILNP